MRQSCKCGRTHGIPSQRAYLLCKIFRGCHVLLFLALLTTFHGQFVRSFVVILLLTEGDWVILHANLLLFPCRIIIHIKAMAVLWCEPRANLRQVIENALVVRFLLGRYVVVPREAGWFLLKLAIHNLRCTIQRLRQPFARQWIVALGECYCVLLLLHIFGVINFWLNFVVVLSGLWMILRLHLIYVFLISSPSLAMLILLFQPHFWLWRRQGGRNLSIATVWHPGTVVISSRLL